jgi:hypothetical protein
MRYSLNFLIANSRISEKLKDIFETFCSLDNLGVSSSTSVLMIWGIFISANLLRHGKFGACNAVTLKSVIKRYDFEHEER